VTEDKMNTIETLSIKMKNLPAIIENPKDGQFMILISEGEFLMGSDTTKDRQAYDAELPQHAHYLDAFYIGIYPVTNEQYKKFVDETGHRPPDKADYGTPIWKGTSFPSEYAHHPVVCVSWDDAKAYCKWAELSLPTEAQWEKAARGIDGRIYPWGDKWDETKCRNYSNNGNQTTCKIWEYPQGVSPYGIFNMSGNVWEWCEDWYEKDVYKRYAKGDVKLPASGEDRVVRGGSWGSYHYGFRCAHRSRRRTGARDYPYGFRCARTKIYT
jgi:formylglycine-generating enzyme required for sulfatase activity